jgi:hypothetical protein
MERGGGGGANPQRQKHVVLSGKIKEDELGFYNWLCFTSSRPKFAALSLAALSHFSICAPRIFLTLPKKKLFACRRFCRQQTIFHSAALRTQPECESFVLMAAR